MAVGQVATHVEASLRYGCGATQLVQLSAVPPSHVAQLEWHAWHSLLLPEYWPATHAARHVVPDLCAVTEAGQERQSAAPAPEHSAHVPSHGWHMALESA